METSIPSPSLWRLGTLSEQSEEKLEESQGTVRDASTTVRRHVSPHRGKGWVIHNWGLVLLFITFFFYYSVTFIIERINWCHFLWLRDYLLSAENWINTQVYPWMWVFKLMLSTLYLLKKNKYLVKVKQLKNLNFTSTD